MILKIGKEQNYS